MHLWMISITLVGISDLSAECPRLQANTVEECQEDDSGSDSEADPEAYYRTGERVHHHEDVKQFNDGTFVKMQKS